MQPNVLTAIRIHRRQSDQSIGFDPVPVSEAVERALNYSKSVILAVSQYPNQPPRKLTMEVGIG